LPWNLEFRLSVFFSTNFFYLSSKGMATHKEVRKPYKKPTLFEQNLIKRLPISKIQGEYLFE